MRDIFCRLVQKAGSVKFSPRWNSPCSATFQQIRLQHDEKNNLKIHIATFNVNEKNPVHEIGPLIGQCVTGGIPTPDIVVLGLQEVTMKPASALRNYVKGDKWSEMLEDVLFSRAYTKVKSKTMVGLCSNVYIKDKHCWAMDDPKGKRVATGMHGLYGNKGATMIHFLLYGKQFTFLNSHLPPHDEGTKKRVETWHKINDIRAKKWCEPQDYMFWNGDLNFRIADQSLDYDKIISMLNDPAQLKELVQKDELIQLMAAGEVFEGWTEPEITFKPTFKVRPEDPKYYNPQRRPAWTDRILYKSDTGRDIVTRFYEALFPSYFGFDHRPVRAMFDIWIER